MHSATFDKTSRADQQTPASTGLKTPRAHSSSTATSNSKMSDSSIVSIQADGKYDFDPSKLVFREPKVMTSGAKLVMLAYAGNQFMIETPTLQCPFGKQEFENPGAATKHSVMLALNDMDTRTDVKEFQALIATIDNLVRTTGFEKSMSWFRKTYKTNETVNDMYTALERKSKNKETGEEDGRWPPSVKLTLPYGPDGKPKFTTYNDRQEEIDLATIEMRHAQVTAIVVLSNVWMAGNMFGVSFKAVQLMVQPKRTMAKCAFRNLKPVESLPAPTGGSTANPDLVDSSDDDEDEADVPLGDE